MGWKNCRDHRNNLVKVHHFAEAENYVHWLSDLCSDSAEWYSRSKYAVQTPT